MAAKWKEILSDRSKYPDDFAVSLKDGTTMTLADMRSYDVEHEGELTQRLTAKEQEIQRREKQVNDASVAIGTLVEQVATRSGLTVEELMAGKAPTKKQVAAASDLDESDPLVGSLVKEIKSLRSELTATKTDIETVRKNALGPMLNTYLEDYYESKWEKLEPTLPKGAKVTRDQALKYAQENKLVDSRGRFDMTKAARDLTYEDRVNEEAGKRAADLRKKDDDARVLAAAPRPSSLGQKTKADKSTLNEKGQTKTFDDVLNDALGDTDLWRGVAGQA